jgi:chemotaxis protein CheZ
MVEGQSALALRDRLDDLRGRYPAAQTDVVAEVVRAVLATMQGDLTTQEKSLFSEVEELGRTIATAKAEIAALGAEDISVNHIPSATDELDAIVAHTASATDIILEVCEMLDRVGGELTKQTSAPYAEAAAAQLQNATMRIYEACSFQDITGQRITKVVATLKTIETKVASIVSVFGGRSESVKVPARVNGTTPPTEMALHGPQLPDVAMDQSDIDKLLASFE